MLSLPNPTRASLSLLNASQPLLDDSMTLILKPLNAVAQADLTLIHLGAQILPE